MRAKGPSVVVQALTEGREGGGDGMERDDEEGRSNEEGAGKTRLRQAAVSGG